MDNLSKLENLLSTHDWYYAYSDDHRVWQRGRDQSNDIQALMTLCINEGVGPEARELFRQHKPS